MPALTCSLHMASSLISKITEDCYSLKPLPCYDPIQCRRYISKCMYISVCLHWTWDTLCCPHTRMYTRSPVSFSWHSMDLWYMCGLYWTLLLGQVTHDRCCQCLLVLSGGPMLQWCWLGCCQRSKLWELCPHMFCSRMLQGRHCWETGSCTYIHIARRWMCVTSI